MAAENKLQELIHKLEVGGWVPWIKFWTVCAMVTVIYSAFIFDLRDWYSFSGLSHEKGMEQAQIGRQLARGEGYTTKMIRPAVLAQFMKLTDHYPSVDHLPDTYHAPLGPVVDAITFKVFDTFNAFLQKIGPASFLTYQTQMDTKTVVNPYDRIIAGVALLFFIASVGVNYLIARRLFDTRLATMGAFLLIGCSRFWRYGLTGLPQHLMLLLFSLATYCLVRALQNREEGKGVLPWLATVGVLFGLLALTHGMTLWIFVGVAVYCGFAFRPAGRTVAILVGIVTLMYAPWLVHNYRACGDLFGIAPYAGLTQVRGTETDIMRSQDLDFGVTPSNFRAKVQKGSAAQLSDLYTLLGGIVVAPIFFLSLLHAFKRRDTASFRWGLFVMWACAFFGMAAFGLNDRELQSNDLHLLFIPLLTHYGLAFVLVLWTRREINVRLIRIGFIALIYAISVLPMVNLVLEKQNKVQWPPYVPSFIAILNKWTNNSEIIMSDMPWAVAWYADRSSLWLPGTINEFLEMNDYQRLGGKVVGMYLTPISGNQPFITGIAKGPYKEWAPFIMRNANIKDFPLRAVTSLPIDAECVFYADRERWRERED